MTAKINGKSISCLLDSGCERGVIVQSLFPDLHLIRSSNILSAANRTDLSILGDTNLHFTNDKFVSPAIDEFLLGSDWLVTIGRWRSMEWTMTRLPLS